MAPTQGATGLTIDFAEAGFILDIAIFLGSVPIAYLSWASGLMNSMYEQAKGNGWVYPPKRSAPNYRSPEKAEDHVRF